MMILKTHHPFYCLLVVHPTVWKILFIQFMLSIYNSKDPAIQISFNGL